MDNAFGYGLMALPAALLAMFGFWLEDESNTAIRAAEAEQAQIKVELMRQQLHGCEFTGDNNHGRTTTENTIYQRDSRDTSDGL